DLHPVCVEERNVLVRARQELIGQNDYGNLVMLSIVEGIEGIVEALRNISRCNDDPGKLAVGSVEREPQIRLFRARWECCGGSGYLPPNDHRSWGLPLPFPPHSF